MLDLDTPLSPTLRAPSIHWLATLSPSPSLNVSSTHTAYQPPEPPIGDVAHTYAFFLFAPAPANVVVPAQRSPFNWEDFLRGNGLAERDVVARNHFRVRNLAGTPTVEVFPPERARETVSLASGTGAAGAVFTGGVGSSRVKSGMGALVVGGVVLGI
ncbi:hypothetical protein CC86DRAFT_369605, partial [Ophiobolus disseminans]